MSIFAGKGGSATLPTGGGGGFAGLFGGGKFPAAPLASGAMSKNPFEAFASSPIGQRMSGAVDATGELFGGSKPGLIGLLQQQGQWGQARQGAMSPEDKSRQQMFGSMAQSGQQMPQFSPAQFGGGNGSDPLAEFVKALLAKKSGAL